MGIRIEKTEDTVAYSKLVISDGCVPCRIVLRKLEDPAQYCTHLETFEALAMSLGREVVFRHTGFSSGSYFRGHGGEALAEASKDFADRARKL
jgi:hypothetical protein